MSHVISCEIFSHVKFHIRSHNFTCYHMISHEITRVNSCGFFVRDIWDLKNKKRTFNIKWSILKQASPYRSCAKSCNLCIQEKLEILKGDKKRLLNRRCELFSKCCHRKQFLAGKFKRAHAIQSRK